MVSSEKRTTHARVVEDSVVSTLNELRMHDSLTSAASSSTRPLVFVMTFTLSLESQCMSHLKYEETPHAIFFPYVSEPEPKTSKTPP